MIKSLETRDNKKNDVDLVKEIPSVPEEVCDQFSCYTCGDTGKLWDPVWQKMIRCRACPK